MSTKPSSTRGLVLFGVLALALGVLPGSETRAEEAPGYISATALNARVAKTIDGLATTLVPTGADGVIVMAHRRKSGEVEVHQHMHDEFIAREGRATVLVGGKVEGARKTGPNEWRGGEIIGAQSHEMGPGDMLWIPAGQPHQVILPSGGHFIYLAVKFPAATVAGAPSE